MRRPFHLNIVQNDLTVSSKHSQDETEKLRNILLTFEGGH